MIGRFEKASQRTAEKQHGRSNRTSKSGGMFLGICFVSRFIKEFLVCRWSSVNLIIQLMSMIKVVLSVSILI